MTDMDSSLPPIQFDAEPAFYAGGQASSLQAYRLIGGSLPDRYATEESRLQQLLDRHKVEAALKKLGDAGYVIRLSAISAPREGLIYDAAGSLSARAFCWQEEGAAGTAPVILAAADDVVWNYTAASMACLKMLTAEVRETLGLPRDEAPEVASQLLSVSEAFARWEDNGRDTYHVLAHELLFGYLLAETKRELRSNQRTDAFDAIGAIAKTLVRVVDGDRQAAPFYLDLASGSMVCDQPEPYLASEGLRTAFAVIRKPRPLLDTIHAADIFQSQGARVGVICGGEPVPQLEKALNLYQQMSGQGQAGWVRWPFAYVVLTKVTNERLIEALLREASTDTILKEQFFSDDPHVMLLIDRSKDQITSFLHTEALVGSSCGARLTGVLSTRQITDDVNAWGLSREDLQRIFAEGAQFVNRSAMQPLRAISSTLCDMLASIIKESSATMSDSARNSLEAQAAHFAWQAKKLVG